MGVIVDTLANVPRPAAAAVAPVEEDFEVADFAFAAQEAKEVHDRQLAQWLELIVSWCL